MKKNTKLFSLFSFLLFVDQALKHFADIVSCNKNLAWSIPIVPAIFYLVWTAIIAVLIYVFFKTKKYSRKIFLIFVFSGAISNLIDRIRLGCVVDYIDIKIFPVFNLGDVYITIGVIMLVIKILKNKSREATL